MSESLFFHQQFLRYVRRRATPLLLRVAAVTIALGSSMFPDENHTARRTRLELDLDRWSTPTINDALLFFF